MGRPCARRHDLVRVFNAGRCAGRSELGDDSEEARGVSRGIPELRSRAGGTVHASANRAPASERRDRSQSAQDREHGPQRARIPRCSEGVRQLRCLRLGLRQGRSAGQRRRPFAAIPARTEQSDALSRDLLRRGFKFVGSTICYAFMQAVGLVNDHTTDCFRYALVGRSRPVLRKSQ